MAKLVLRQEAIDDLNQIWKYTAHKWSVAQADKYYQKIKTACQEIANNSVVGRGFDSVKADLIGYRIGKHIIFYQSVPNDGFEVIRILHERMDLKNRIHE